MKDNLFEEEIQTTETRYVTERNKPMPSKNHSRIQARINYLIISNYDKKYIPHSEISLDLEDWSSVPDVAIYEWTKYEPTEDEIKVTTPPLCVIEILSPTQTQTDLLIKTKEYFEKGVKSCWIVFPRLQNIYIFSDEITYKIFLKGEILKDEEMEIELTVDEIFE